MCEGCAAGNHVSCFRIGKVEAKNFGVEKSIKETSGGEENGADNGESNWELSAWDLQFRHSIVEASPELQQRRNRFRFRFLGGHCYQFTLYYQD